VSVEGFAPSLFFRGFSLFQIDFDVLAVVVHFDNFSISLTAQGLQDHLVGGPDPVVDLDELPAHPAVAVDDERGGVGDAAASGVSTLQTELNTAEADIVVLQADVNAAEADIAQHMARIRKGLKRIREVITQTKASGVVFTSEQSMEAEETKAGSAQNVKGPVRAKRRRKKRPKATETVG